MYHRLNHIEFNVKKQIPPQPGVYRIIAVDDNGDPVTINRLLDQDQSGTLYIGKSENLQKRLGNMRRAFSLEYKSTKHIAVRRYRRLKRIEEKYPIDKIVIEFELTKAGQIARELERQKLDLYERLMGELPPLNKQ